MANATTELLELRFVIEPSWTTVHVLYSPASDGTLGVEGWHTKRFPKEVPVDEILFAMFHRGDDPVLWPHEGPRQVVRVGVPGASVGVG